jgi:hypothetical protein
LLIFAASTRFWVGVVAAILLSFILMIVEWVSLHQFGVFFDAFVPVLALWLHSVYDRLFTSTRTTALPRDGRSKVDLGSGPIVGVSGE